MYIKLLLLNLAGCPNLLLKESLLSVKFIPQFPFIWPNSLFRFSQGRVVGNLYFFPMKLCSTEILLENENSVLQINPRGIIDYVYIHLYSVKYRELPLIVDTLQFLPAKTSETL